MSSRGSPTWASTRSAAVTWAMLAESPSTPSTRSRIELSTGARAGELSGSSLAATVVASTSARAAAPRPPPRSSRGRSSGSTQTSGCTPDRRATASRSWATAPSVRSSTVTSPPALSRGAAIMVSSADQPASVPPATSTRSIPSGSDTAYHCSWRSNASRRDSQARTCWACCSWRTASRLSCTSLILATRCCSAAIRSRSTRSACRIRCPLAAAAAARQHGQDHGEPDVQQPGHPEPGHQPEQRQRGPAGQLQRAVQPVLLPPLRIHPALVELLGRGWRGTARQRAGIGVPRGVLPAEVDPVRPDRRPVRRATAGRDRGGALMPAVPRPGPGRACSAAAPAAAGPGPAGRTFRRDDHHLSRTLYPPQLPCPEPSCRRRAGCSAPS